MPHENVVKLLVWDEDEPACQAPTGCGQTANFEVGSKDGTSLFLCFNHLAPYRSTDAKIFSLVRDAEPCH